jgi:hypothetical protein
LCLSFVHPSPSEVADQLLKHSSTIRALQGHKML